MKVLAGLVAVDAALFGLEALRALSAGVPEAAFLGGGLAVLQFLVAVGLWMLEPYAWGATTFVLAVVFLAEAAMGAHYGALLSAGVGLYLYTQKHRFET